LLEKIRNVIIEKASINKIFYEFPNLLVNVFYSAQEIMFKKVCGVKNKATKLLGPWPPWGGWKVLRYH
jgi:hypothetical protein